MGDQLELLTETALFHKNSVTGQFTLN